MILLSVVALAAMSAAPASAEETLLAEWLFNGESIGSSLASKWEGELNLEDTKVGVGIKCSLIADGTLGKNGEGKITAILSLAGTEVSLSSPLLCKAHKTCEENATDIELAPEKLPWATKLVKTESGSYLEITTEYTYFVACLVLGTKVSEECTWTKSSFEALNIVAGVEFAGQSSPKGNCTTGGTESGLVEQISSNKMSPTEGGTLSLSAEGPEPEYEGKGAEKKVEEGEYEESVNQHMFEFDNGVLKRSAVCTATFGWPAQPGGASFLIAPRYANCAYNGVALANPITSSCHYRLKLPVPLGGGRFWTTLDVTGAGCEVKMELGGGCVVKVTSGANNQNLATVNEENKGANLKIIIIVNMAYTSAGCAAPIEAAGTTRYAGEAELTNININ